MFAVSCLDDSRMPLLDQMYPDTIEAYGVGPTFGNLLPDTSVVEFDVGVRLRERCVGWSHEPLLNRSLRCVRVVRWTHELS